MGRATKVLGRTAAIAAIVGLTRVGAGGAAFAARSGKARRSNQPLIPGVPAPRPSASLAGAVALDQTFVGAMRVLSTVMPSGDYHLSSAELDEAVLYYDAQGWIDDPSSYFVDPPPLTEVDITVKKRRKGPVEVLRFESLYQPHPGEPGADRWQSFEKNKFAYANMLRHPGAPRPWLVFLHGSGLGRVSDLETYRLRRLHHELGVNILMPVLPLHAQRTAGFTPSKMFVSNVYPVNNVLGLTQAVWDIRRLLSWLRSDQLAPSIGVYGFSLGSYLTSLLVTMERDLTFALAVVPNADLAGSLRAVEPSLPSKRKLHRQVHDWRSAKVHQIVSPLSRPCLLPKEDRYIMASVGDHVADPAGAVLLWQHWDQPEITWYPRGHLTIYQSADFNDRLDEILRSNGVVGTPVERIS